MMADKQLLLQADTSAQIDSFLVRPGSALLISGQAGSGKKTTARYIAAELLGTESAKLESQPYFLLLQKPDGKSEIPIELIRQLISKMSLKAPVTEERAINRLALIEDARFLSDEAQNALLKLLEEPPAGTLLILTTGSDDELLPTIVSRTQKLNIKTPTLEQSVSYFSDYPKPAVESAWRLSQGGAGLLSALLSQDADHQLKQAVSQAKDFVSQTTYQRLISLQKLSKDKPELLVFLDGLARVLGALHSQSLANHRPNSNKILRSRQAVEQAIKSCQANANTRLISLRLALNIPL